MPIFDTVAPPVLTLPNLAQPVPEAAIKQALHADINAAADEQDRLVSRPPIYRRVRCPRLAAFSTRIAACARCTISGRDFARLRRWTTMSASRFRTNDPGRPTPPATRSSSATRTSQIGDPMMRRRRLTAFGSDSRRNLRGD